MRSARQQAGPADQRMLDEFFSQQEASAGPRAARAGPAAFQFSDLHNELDNIHMGPHHMPQQGGWAGEFETMSNGPKLWELNPEEASAMEKTYQACTLNHEHGPCGLHHEHPPCKYN